MRSAVLGLFLAAGGAAAGPLTWGEKLVEQQSLDHSLRRVACGSQFCFWDHADYLGGCSEAECKSHELEVTDREGRVLGASTHFVSSSTIRFLSPRQIELVWPVTLIGNSSGQAWDAGFAPVVWQRETLTLSQDGKEFVARTPEVWLSPERHKRLYQLIVPPGDSEERPRVKPPVTAAVLTKARKACGVKERLEAVHHECHQGACLLVLGEKSEERTVFVCTLEVKEQQVRLLPIGKLVEHADEFQLSRGRACFVDSTGGIRGGPGDEQCISRDQPGRMAFLDTQGLHLESGERYPVRKVDSEEEGRKLAPTVHAFTAAQVTWGMEGWRGEKDLSLAWQAMRVGEVLQLRVEVDDDVLVLLGPGTAVNTDHLELDFWPSREAAFKKQGVLLKLGVLLAGEGRAQVRTWKRRQGGQDQDMDEEYAASGTWARTERGYVVDVPLPLGPLREQLGPQPPFILGLMASDADEKGRQETLLGTRGALRFWDEYPPTLEEFLRERARTP